MNVKIEQIISDKTTTTVDLGAPEAQMAVNPNTDPQLLRKIATAPDWELRQLVASNPNTPTDLLWQLGIDFPEAILSNPVFQLLQIERLNLVTEIPPATLTSLLQCERVPRSFMEYAVSQQDYSLWLAVAYNPHTPGTLLEKLAQKSRRQDRELIRAVAAHPHTPPQLLAEIIDIGSNIAQIVAENIHTPVPVLEQILYRYGKTQDATFTTLVALHPHLNPRLLMQMKLAPNESAAQSLWLAKQPETTAQRLVELAQTDWEVLRIAIVRHPHTPSETIEQIWHQMQIETADRQLDRSIYDSFVGNPNTSAQIRSELRKLLKW